MRFDVTMAEAVRDQARFEREQYEARVARILAAAKKDPDLTIDLLAERFNMSSKGMEALLRRHGLRRDHSSRIVITRAEERAINAPRGHFLLAWDKKKEARK